MKSETSSDDESSEGSSYYSSTDNEDSTDVEGNENKSGERGLKTLRQLLLRMKSVEHDLDQTDISHQLDQTDLAEFRSLLQDHRVIAAKDNEGTTALHDAAKLGLLGAAEELITAGAEISATDSSKLQPLHMACLRGHTRLAKLLIDKGANIEAKCGSSATPLDKACSRGHVDIINLLLDKGSNAQPVDDDRRPPLHLASKYGYSQVTRILLRKDKSNIDFIEKRNGWTALHLAIYHRQKEVVSVLLEYGAALKHQDSKGRTPLMMAIEQQSTDITRMLLTRRFAEEDIQVEQANQAGRTPLLLASIDGFFDGVRQLIDAGADGNVRSKHSKSTPLIAATSWGYADIVRVLLERKVGIDINVTDNDGQTALHIACSQNHTEIVNVLLQCGVDIDVNSIDEDGQTALQIACSQNHGEIVQLLLRRDDIDTRHQDKHKWTALHFASEHGNASVISALLKAGAEVETKTSKGKTPLHLASGAQDSSQLDGVEQKRSRQIHAVQVLFEAGAKPTAKTRKNKTALHLAAKCGDPEKLRIVLNHMKPNDVLARDNKHRTALGSAFEGNDKELAMRILLESDMIKTADFGENQFADEALLWAARNSRTHDIARMILQKRSRSTKPAMSKEHECSAIELAAHDGLPQVLWPLISNSAINEQTKCDLKAALRRSLASAEDLGEDGDWGQLSQILWLLITASERTSDIEPVLASALASVEKIHGHIQHRYPPDQQQPQKAQEQSEDLMKTGRNNKKGPVVANHNDKMGHDEQDYLGMTKDLLRDPPFKSRQIYRDSETYNLAKLPEGDVKEVLEQFDATIVQFYKDKDVSETDQRCRPVYEVIYDKGPTEVMQTAVAMRKAIANLSNSGGKGSKSEIAPEFTWVHLPSTNMEWMNDLLTRIMKDANYTARQYHKFRSFFRDSWTEVPDPKTSSRIMRPRTVVSRQENVGSETHDTEHLEEENSSNPEWSRSRRHRADGKAEKRVRRKDRDVLHKEREIAEEAESGQASNDSSVAASAIYMPFLCFSTHCEELADSDRAATGGGNSGGNQNGQNNLGEIKPTEIKPTEIKPTEIKPTEIKPTEIKLVKMNSKNNPKEEKTHKSQTDTEHGDFRARKEKYERLLAAYKSSECSGVHRSPTLDEWYYHFANDKNSSKDKHHRNEKQVVTEFIKSSKSSGTHGESSGSAAKDTSSEERGRVSEHNGRNFNSVKNNRNCSEGQESRQSTADGRNESDKPSEWTLLRVNQLWIWTIENKWLITATSCSFDTSHDALVGDILELLNKQADYGGSLSQPASPVDMSKLIVDHFIRLYEKRPKSLSPMSVSQTFSNHMNKIGRDETALFGEFSVQTQSWEQGSQGKEEIKKAIKRARELYHDIKDFRDELNILKSVAHHQRTVQKGLLGNEVEDSNLLATYVVNDLQELDNVAERIQSAVNTTLSLQQSEIANFQAALAVDQGKILMIFTFATLLFLPLSFLTSLFALDVASFLQTPGWAFVVIFLVSVAVSALVALSAIYWNDIRTVAGQGVKLAGGSATPVPKPSAGENEDENPYEQALEQAPAQAPINGEDRSLGLFHRVRRRPKGAGGSLV